MNKPAFRFGKSRRLHTGDEFAEVLRRGRRLSGTRFQVCVRPNRLGWARLGLIVGRKAEPLAVRRNYLKRLVRETFRLHQQELGAWDVVVQVRGRLVAARCSGALRDELHDLFMAVKAWRG